MLKWKPEDEEHKFPSAALITKYAQTNRHVTDSVTAMHWQHNQEMSDA